MRLYLSSFLLGNHAEKLVALAGDGKRAALILNALDNRQEARDRYGVSQTDALSQLGFSVEELDLRKYFGKPDALEKFLQSQDIVWINGGNTFVLRRAMKQSGFDHLIKKRLEEDSIVYAGFSAAVVVLPADMRGLEIIDDPIEVSAGYETETLWDGLGLIDFSVAVHYDSDHPESSLTDKEILYYEERGIPYKKLRDGEVIIVEGNKMQHLTMDKTQLQCSEG